jgi:protein involved in polysaccharide export with SLBB domain
MAQQMRLLLFISLLIMMFLHVGYGTDVESGSGRDSLRTGSTYRYYERPIDPDWYLIRPGEQFTVTFLKTRLPSLYLTVDAEGQVVDRTLGVINLADMTLTQARQILSKALSHVYSADEIVISVGVPLPVTVLVSGMVNRPGRYRAFSSQRVSEIIDSAGGITPGGSTRFIQFTGAHGEQAVDLDRAEYLADPLADPCLYGGNRLFVPSRKSNSVFVDGAVISPREIELSGAESILQLVALAGGQTAEADIDRSYVIGDSSDNMGVIGEITAGSIIVVPVIGEKGRIGSVKLYGAVARTGRFPFRVGMTLDQLLIDAGGSTNDANLGRITVFRRAENDARGRRSTGRYPISFAGQQTGPDPIKLLPFDSVFVPIQLGYVSVRGGVNFPGLYPFQSGKNAAYYITSAGGYVGKGDSGRLLLFDRITKITAEIMPQVTVRDGDEVIVEFPESAR